MNHFIKKNGYNLTTLPIGQKSLLEDLLASEIFIVCYVICLYSHTVRVGNVLIFEKNDLFFKKTSRKIEKRNDRF